jgi:hypothetical protein
MIRELRYAEQNAVKAGLVTQAKASPSSSAHSQDLHGGLGRPNTP